MRRGGRRQERARVLLAVLMLMVVGGVSGCNWTGVNSLPLPGTQGSGPGSFVIQAQMPDVDVLQQNSRVRVADVTAGTVTKIERQGWHALLTIRLNGDVDLPANATAKIGQTSVLGSSHLELAPPTTEAPRGKLRNGSLIPLSNAGSYPNTEQTLAALGLVLNGGGLGKAQDITEALSTAFRGREGDVRSLLQQLDTFTANLDDQTGDIVAASESLNRLVGKFAAQQPVLDRALKTIPDALAVLNGERGNLVEAATQLSRFSALTADTVDQTKENVVKELREVGPVLESFANAGPSMTRWLDLMTTWPYSRPGVDKMQRGDAANLTMIVDLTLSRLDAGLFTGTRFECNLTELELQWGRTIGQFPSPCMAGGPFNQGNPLIIPYRWDQGR